MNSYNIIDHIRVALLNYHIELYFKKLRSIGICILTFFNVENDRSTYAVKNGFITRQTYGLYLVKN